MTEVIVRLQHGIGFHELKGAVYLFRDKTGDYLIKIHKKFTEVLYIFYDLGGENRILFLIDGVRNPRVALEYAKKARKLTWGDDFLIIVFRNGKVKDFIRISCPPFFLDEIDPRNRRDWPKIAENCQVLYGKNLLDLDTLLKEYCFWFEESVKENILRIKRFIKKYGDDLTTYVLNYKIEKTKREARQYIGVDCRI